MTPQFDAFKQAYIDEFIHRQLPTGGTAGQIIVKIGPGDGEVGFADPVPGDDGLSAYEIAVQEGFVGTEAEWLASLVGPAGSTGQTGPQGPAGADGATGPAGPGLPTGGTTGQAVRKASVTDFDFEFYTPNAFSEALDQSLVTTAAPSFSRLKLNTGLFSSFWSGSAAYIRYTNGWVGDAGGFGQGMFANGYRSSSGWVSTLEGGRTGTSGINFFGDGSIFVYSTDDMSANPGTFPPVVLRYTATSDIMTFHPTRIAIEGGLVVGGTGLEGDGTINVSNGYYEAGVRGWLTPFKYQTATTGNLGDIASAVNAQNKVAGAIAFASNGNTVYVALGSAANAKWRSLEDGTEITPS